MLKIDSHQHFWKYDPIRYGWIGEEMADIRRDFLPADLKPVLDATNIIGCVAVQADQTEAENNFLLQLSNNNDFIKGIVGWVDLRAGNIEERLQHYRGFGKIKGFRHVLQGEADRALMLTPGFMNGIKALGKYGYTYDLLIQPDQLGYTAHFLNVFTDQEFVIDHLAKPPIKEKKTDNWTKDIHEVAKHKNVSCKISGMVTEADIKRWRKEDFTKYMDVIVEAFGPDRIMFGSDWPVCLAAASYYEVLEIVKEYFSSYSEHEQHLFFGGNAVRFYKL